MAAVTGAIWKCATESYENVMRFEELDLVKLLVGIIKVGLKKYPFLLWCNQSKSSRASVLS